MFPLKKKKQEQEIKAEWKNLTDARSLTARFTVSVPLKTRNDKSKLSKKTENSYATTTTTTTTILLNSKEIH